MKISFKGKTFKNELNEKVKKGNNILEIKSSKIHSRIVLSILE
jgi:hypothetical protein